MARTMPKDSPLSDATVAMAVTEWFRRSTQIQIPRRWAATIQEDAQVADKLFSALQERHFGPDWQTIQKAALQEDTAAEGGNLVPTIVEADILRQVKDASKLYPLARQISMTRKVHQVPSETTAVTVNWIDEESALTQGEPAFAQKTLTAEKLAGRAKMSLELVEDSAPGLLAYLLTVFTEKMGGELDKQIVLGDGSGPQITGIDTASGINVISSSVTAAGRALTYALLVNTFTGASESSAIETGYWIVSPKGYTQILALSGTDNQPIVKFGTVETAPSGMLLGRPIVVSAPWGGAATPDEVTNTNTKIIYGPPSSLLFGTRMGMRWGVTDQVGWANFQMDARLVGRFAGNVAVPANFSRLSKVNY